MASKMKKNYREVVENVDAMHEIFKNLDAQMLAVASCVSRRWHQAAMDDNLWEVICTQHWPATGISIGRLRSVVNVLGGFKRLYVKWLHPLRRHSGGGVAAASRNKHSLEEDNTVWSHDQVQLSLSLFSVEYYEKLGSFRTSSCTLSNPRLLHNVHPVFSIPIETKSNEHA